MAPLNFKTCQMSSAKKEFSETASFRTNEKMNFSTNKYAINGRLKLNINFFDMSK